MKKIQIQRVIGAFQKEANADSKSSRVFQHNLIDKHLKLA